MSKPLQHECRFDEVLIERADESNVLKAGMLVLVPCACGETPLDNLNLMDSHLKESQRAVRQLEPHRALYHWAPSSRFKQIKRYGMRPHMQPVTTSEGFRASYTCWADDPAWAWRLSGGQPRFDKGGEWELFMTWLDRINPEDATILSCDWRPSGIYEVRVSARIYKRDVLYVASREK